jgi:hypothetical protein
MMTMAYIDRAVRYVIVTALGAVIAIAGGINIGLHALGLPFAAAQDWAARRIRSMAKKK